jgi:cytidine deaminase
VDNEVLIAHARACAGEFTLSDKGFSAGSVAAALVTEAGHVYTGICIDLACGIGFCAEHSAVAAMLLNRETVIKKIVAVADDKILPPCGRCRELLQQVDRHNLDCEVIMPDGGVMPLRALLPHSWL